MAKTAANKNVMSAVAYLVGFITGIIVLFMADKKDSYTRFHAMQSILFSVAVIVVNYILGLLLMFSWMAYSAVMGLYGLAVFILWLFLMWKAYTGVEFELPFLGKLAKDFMKKV